MYLRIFLVKEVLRVLAELNASETTRITTHDFPSSLNQAVLYITEQVFIFLIAGLIDLSNVICTLYYSGTSL